VLTDVTAAVVNIMAPAVVKEDEEAEQAEASTGEAASSEE
jgi:hypothetical protein